MNYKVNDYTNWICLCREVDDKCKGSLDRMLNIWKERGVFEADFIEFVRMQLSK